MSATPGQELQDALRRAVGQQDTTIAVDTGAAGVSVDVESVDRYAVGVRGLRVRPAEPVADVGGAAERIAERVDVIDPLRVIEYDAPAQEAILRSAEPAADQDGVTYWEATVRPGDTSVQRYHKAHGEPDRQPLVEPVMHRALGRLADQIVDALGEPQS